MFFTSFEMSKIILTQKAIHLFEHQFHYSLKVYNFRATGITENGFINESYE